MLLDPRPLYDIYEVTCKLREKMYGGMSKDPEVIKAWVKATTGYDDELTAVQTAEALEVATEEKAEGMWTGFPKDERGLFVWTRQVKALLRESAIVLGITKKKRGSREIVHHGFEVKGEGGGSRVYLGGGGEGGGMGGGVLGEPDGADEGPIHVMTPRGPRTALKRQDYVEGRTFAFGVWILKTHPSETRHLGQVDVTQMLTFAQEDGLGASRSQGHGKFDVVRLDKVGT